MKTFIQFIKDFIANKGLLVFISYLVQKLSALITTVFIARMLSKEDFGLIAMAMLIFGMCMPFLGGGSYQGLLRFGMLTDTSHQKDRLSHYAFHKGIVNNFGVTVIFLLVSFLFSFKYENLMSVSFYLVLRLFAMFLFSQVSTDYRIRNNNKAFAWLGIIFNIFNITVAVLLTYYFGKMGYIWALAFAPLIIIIYAKKYFNFQKLKPIKFINLKDFWKYALFTSFTYFLSEWVMMMDHFLVGFYYDESALASYRIASLLPFNIIFLSKVFLQTDFPKIAREYQNKAFLVNYYTNYLKLFIPLSLFILLVGYVCKDSVLPFFFGPKYTDGNLFFILLFYTFVAMVVFVPIGNILVAVGKPQKNLILAALNLVLMVICVRILEPLYGVVSVPITVVISFTVSSLVGLYFFKIYLKNLQ